MLKKIFITLILLTSCTDQKNPREDQSRTGTRQDDSQASGGEDSADRVKKNSDVSGTSPLKEGVYPVSFQFTGVHRPGEARDLPIVNEDIGYVAQCVNAPILNADSAKSLCLAQCQADGFTLAEWTGFWLAFADDKEKGLCECILATKNNKAQVALREAEEKHKELKKMLDEEKAKGNPDPSKQEELNEAIKAAALAEYQARLDADTAAHKAEEAAMSAKAEAAAQAAAKKSFGYPGFRRRGGNGGKGGPAGGG